MTHRTSTRWIATASALATSMLIAMPTAQAIVQPQITVDCETAGNVEVFGSAGDTVQLDFSDELSYIGFTNFSADLSGLFSFESATGSFDGEVTSNDSSDWEIYSIDGQWGGSVVSLELLAENDQSDLPPNTLSEGSVLGIYELQCPDVDEEGAFIWGGAGGSNPGAADAAAVPAVPTYGLAFDAAGGFCPTSTASALDTTWTKLPTDCTKAGATFLGWSTSSTFPVDRASTQVSLDWGAIDETIDGQRMIFIPIGGSTILSGDNTLHAVWKPAA